MIITRTFGYDGGIYVENVSSENGYSILSKKREYGKVEFYPTLTISGPNSSVSFKQSPLSIREVYKCVFCGVPIEFGSNLFGTSYYVKEGANNTRMSYKSPYSYWTHKKMFDKPQFYVNNIKSLYTITNIITPTVPVVPQNIFSNLMLENNMIDTNTTSRYDFVIKSKLFTDTNINTIMKLIIANSLIKMEATIARNDLLVQQGFSI